MSNDRFNPTRYPKLYAMLIDRCRLLRQLTPTLPDVGGGMHIFGNNAQRQEERRARRAAQKKLKIALLRNAEITMAYLTSCIPKSERL